LIEGSNNRIYVNNQLHGEVVNGMFIRSSLSLVIDPLHPYALVKPAQPMDTTHTQQLQPKEQSS